MGCAATKTVPHETSGADAAPEDAGAGTRTQALEMVCNVWSSFESVGTRGCVDSFGVCGKKTAAKRNKNETENNKTHDERTIRPTALCAPEDAPGESIMIHGQIVSLTKGLSRLMNGAHVHSYMYV